MGCREGIDPADFETGALDPADDVAPSTISVDDAEAVYDGTTRYVRFTIGVSNINFTDAITVRSATSNGTALSGTHYTSHSNVLRTIPAGESEVTFDVPVLAPAGSSGIKTFTVTLSSPTNATIEDATGTGTIDYSKMDVPSGGGGTPPPPPTDPLTIASFVGAESSRVTYDQFPGCAYDAACTAYAVAAAMGVLAARKNLGRWRFNPKKLFQDMGGRDCLNGAGNCDHSLCPGENPAKAVNWAANTGVQRIDDNATFVSGTNYSCKYRDVTADHDMFKLGRTELGGSGKTMTTIINDIKRAIYNNGVVYMASIFYTNWNSCRGEDNHILRPHGNDNSSLGHAWILTGWDNARQVPNTAAMGSLAGQKVGCFQIQSSHGCDWGVNGRGWIPYSYLRTNWPSGSNAPRYRYWRLTWAGPA